MKRTITASLLAVTMLALAGCSQPLPADDVGDTAEREAFGEVEGPEHGVMPDMPRVWAVPGEPDPAAAPLQASLSSRLQKWWKEIWAKIKGDDPAPTPIPTPTPTPTPDPVTPPAQADVNTFLWKPVADNDGRLVVLLPANLTASTVTVNGEQPAAYTGRGNGNRQHFRFRKKGADYGDNVVVIAVGTARRWTVPKGGTRWSSN